MANGQMDTIKKKKKLSKMNPSKNWVISGVPVGYAPLVTPGVSLITMPVTSHE